MDSDLYNKLEPQETVAAKDNKNEEMEINSKVLKMMGLMGFKLGSGLGKDEQGIITPINVASQLGKQGLGFQLSNETWDFNQEDICVKEHIEWLYTTEDFNLSNYKLSEWIKEDLPITIIDEQHEFCQPELLKSVMKAKNIFDTLDFKGLNQARARANAFETIRSVFFINRAALKMANIDAATGFMFTNIDDNIYHHCDYGPYYFADVCAGPGGFTEYILWRKSWKFKGFGFTLRGENDFNLHGSQCASNVTFHQLYGAAGDGDICRPKNIDDFREKVLHETEGKGVHFMMSDGGFSVEGNENLQEVLSKNIYICQCLVALEILRSHGHFVTKLFDIFTRFSVGLLFLMSKCFEKVCILKPNSSRPANSERYFIAFNYKNNETSTKIKNYIHSIVNRLWDLRQNDNLDIIEIVPLSIIKEDTKFFNYIYNHNNNIAKKQTINLKKLAAFYRNPLLNEQRQTTLRTQCLQYWRIPDQPKIILPKLALQDIPSLINGQEDLLAIQPREFTLTEDITNVIINVSDWHFAPMQCTRRINKCNFYVGLSHSKVYRLQSGKWVKVKNLQLVRGTLLYGEIAKENIVKNNADSAYKYSLHVIDALRLGDLNLGDLNFEERLKLIRTYCTAVNHEFSTNRLRMRPKVINKLEYLPMNSLIKSKSNANYFSLLPTLSFGADQDLYEVNSILLLKTSEKQSFHSTYILRLQLFITNTKLEENKEKMFPLEELINFIDQKSKK